MTEWKEVRPEQPWLRPWELVGSSAQAGVGNGTGWVRKMRLWRCSPRRELHQDGLVGEIDRRLAVGGEIEKREIGAARKTSGGAAQLGVLGGGEASSWRPIYRRWKAVERGALMAGRRASRRPLMATGVVERRREQRGGSGTTGRVGQGRSKHLGRVERMGAQGRACGVWEARLRRGGARRRSRRPARLWPGEQLGVVMG